MKTIRANYELIIFSVVIVALVTVVTFNAVTYGICDTGSFTF